MKIRVGELAYALDYKEPVMIVAIEQASRPKDDFAGTFTVERWNGSTTQNYPGYLLESATDGHKE